MLENIPVTLEQLQQLTNNFSPNPQEALEDIPEDNVFWGQTLTTPSLSWNKSPTQSSPRVETREEKEQNFSKTSLGSGAQKHKILTSEKFEALKKASEDQFTRLEFKSGKVYNGQVFNGNLHGIGTLQWDNGVTFKGQFKKNQIVGYGEYQWKDNSTYQGQVIHSLRHGKGIFKSDVNGVEYEGEWKNGLKHGKGELRYKSGAIYSGQFLKGFKHGKGLMKYPSGNYYEGYYKFDKKSGYGEMYWLNKNETYKGFWEKDKQNGFGEHIWEEKASKSKSMRNRYEGMFFEGLRHGYGIFFYSDGTRYEGEWVNNMKQGFAFFTDATGDIIEAIFKEDRQLKRLDTPRKYDFIGFVDNDTQESSEGAKNKKVMRGRSPITKGNKFKSGRRSPSKGKRLKMKSQKKSLNENEEFIKRNQVNEISNPYIKILRLDDLLDTVPPEKRELTRSNIEIVMLRYNTMFVNLYKIYKERSSNITHYSFTLKLRNFWQFLRDARILTPELSLAQFNRSFYLNKYNRQNLHFDFNRLREKIKNLKLKYYGSSQRKMDVLLKLDVYLRNHFNKFQLSKIDYSRLVKISDDLDELQWGRAPQDNFQNLLQQFDLDLKSSFESDLISDKINHDVDYMKRQMFSIHDIDNIILFRNFVDGFIRAVYLRNNFVFEKIDQEIEKTVIYRVRPLFYHLSAMMQKSEKKKSERDTGSDTVSKKTPLQNLGFNGFAQQQEDMNILQGSQDTQTAILGLNKDEEDSQNVSMNFNTSDINQDDVKDDVVKPEAITLNLKLYSLLIMSKQDQEHEILMNKIVKKLNLETDPVMKQIY